jgi:MFS family permease
MALIVTAHGPGTRSFAANLFGVGEYVGVAMGGWFGSYVAQEFHWRWTFYSLGLLGILFAIPYSSFLRRFEESPSPEPHGAQSLSVSALIKVPTYLFVCLTYSCRFVVFWPSIPGFRSFCEKFSLSLAEAGFTATVYLQSANLVDRSLVRPRRPALRSHEGFPPLGGVDRVSSDGALSLSHWEQRLAVADEGCRDWF